MNYYIQGDAANAGKIKAAFEKLGIDVLDFGFADKTLVYCSIGGCVQSLPYSINLMHILYSHPDYQELELTVKPKFKVGDEIFRPARNEYFKIKDIEKDNGTVWYVTTRTRIADNDKRIGEIVRINAFYQNGYSIAPKSHYDIANFHVGMPVLVRSDNDCSWDYSVFSRNTGNEYWPFAVCNGVSFTQCIPFNEDTKHLLGTTDPCGEEYINW